MQMRSSGVVVLLFCICCWRAAAAPQVVNVSTDLELRQALLRSPQVEHVVLLRDIQFQPENWPEDDSSEPPVYRRNLTITSSPRFNVLDFAFLASNWIRLAPGVQLNISDTILKQSRYGVGMPLDFLAPSAGAVLVLHNSIVLRHWCVGGIDEVDAIRFVPRIAGFPGKQQAHYADSYCFRDGCFDKVMVYDNFVKSSASPIDAAAGGYAMALFNSSKVCRGFLDGCKDSSSLESCMQRAIDALLNAAPTPGRIAASAAAAKAAQAAEQERKRQAATLGGAIAAAAGMGILLVVLFALVVRHKRRLRGLSSGKPWTEPQHSKHTPGGAAAAVAVDRSSTGAGGSPRDDDGVGVLGYFQQNSKDLEAAVHGHPSVSSTTPSSLNSSRQLSQTRMNTPEAQFEQLGPYMPDSWELAAWKTSSHSMKPILQQQQQHQSSGDVGAAGDRGALNTSGSHLTIGSNKQLSSHELILQGTGLSTSQAMQAGNKISLGVCIGAGSFGKVYKGRWRGMDVAVKVVMHSQAAAASVANEIDLMMNFHHQNVVSAYHFVTWRRRKERLQHCSGEVLPVMRQPTMSSSSLSCGNNSFAADTSPCVDAAGEDMLTYIVQEYCDAGNLGDYNIIHGDRQRGQLPTGHAMLRLLFRLREVAEGMQFLHDTASVVHGDLKSSNILLCVAPTAPYGRIAKVADFGLSRVYAAGETHKSTRTLGTVNHMAPELLRYGKASTAADVYSFGIMMWELLTGEVAFKGWQWGAILEHVALGDSPGRLPVPEGAPEGFVLLMEACWGQDPAKRPAFAEVLKCLKILITSQQQALIEQAASVSLTSHTLTTPLSGASNGVVSWPEQPSVSTGHLTGLVNTVSSSVVDTYGGCAAGASGSAAMTSTDSNGEFDVVRVGSSLRRASGSSNSNVTAGSVATGALVAPAVVAAPGSGTAQLAAAATQAAARAAVSIVPAVAAVPGTGAGQVAASILGNKQTPGPGLHVLPAAQQQRRQRQQRASSPQVMQVSKLQTQPGLQRQQQQLHPQPPPEQQQQQQPLQEQQQWGQTSGQQPKALQKVHMPAVASLSDLLSQQQGVRSTSRHVSANHTGGTVHDGTSGITDGGHGPQDL